MRTRTLLTLTLLLAAPAAAQDVAAARRHLRSARSDLEGRRHERAEEALRRAEAALAGPDEAARAPVLEEVAALRAALEEGARRSAGQRLAKQVERLVDAARADLERNAGARDVREVVERRLAEAEALLADPEAVRSIEAPARAELAALIATTREAAARSAGEGALARVAGPLSRAEQALGAATFTRDHVVAWLRDAEAALPGVAGGERDALARRVAAARARYAEITGKEDTDARVRDLASMWEARRRAGEGWRDERPRGFDDWLASRDLGLPLTAEHAEAAAHAAQDERLVAARRDLAQDPRVAALAAEVDAARAAAAGKLCQAAAALLEPAESADAGDDRLVPALEALRATLDRSAAGAAEHAATRGRVDALLGRLAAGAAEAAAALEARRAACLAAAAELWPRWVEALAPRDLDAPAALRDPAAWQGARVRLTGKRNRAGWDYEAAGWTVIATLDGVPVACKLHDELKAALVAFEAETGLALDPREIEDLVAEVDGTAQVQGIRYSQALREYRRTDVLPAPRLRIVALRAGPIAAAVGQGTVLQAVEDARDVAPAGGGRRGLVVIAVTIGLVAALLLAAAGLAVAALVLWPAEVKALLRQVVPQQA